MSTRIIGGGGKPEEEKTVTAGTSVIEVLPSSGKTMKKVTVNPTPSQSKTVTPSTSQQTVSPDAGKLLSQVIVNAMASGALSDITVSSAGLITAQVGTSGYLASGTKKTKQLTTQAAKTVTPSKSVQTAVASGIYTTGAVKVAAIPAKYIDLATKFGCTKVAVNKFTFTSNTALRDAGEISHSLGEIPKVAIILSTLRSTTTANHIIAAILLPSSSGYFTCPLLYTTTTAESYSSGTLSVPRTASAIGPVYASQYFTGGVEYTLITMA